MYYLAASGLCLAAIFGSAIYENHRMKKEEERLRHLLERIRRENQDI